MFSNVDGSHDADRAVAYLESAAESLASIKRDMLRRLLVAAGERVLDVGCGAGHDLELLDTTGARVVGIDTSVRMVEESRRRVPGAAVVRADGAYLPFASDTFDACRIERVLQHVADPRALLREAARVLHSGTGRIVVFEPDWGSLAIDSDNAALATAVTTSVMLGVRHPRAGLQLRRMLVETGFTVEAFVVDVGLHESMQQVRRFLDVKAVRARALASGLATPADFTTWEREMDERSARGTFQSSLNRMIVSARLDRSGESKSDGDGEDVAAVRL